MDLDTAIEITGSLTRTSKMPGYSYSIPAQHCKQGTILREIEDSPCHDCYAMKGFYRMDNVRAAQEKRFQSITDPRWEDAMVVHIRAKVKTLVPWFRWHDAGDIQSIEHAHKIFNIARRLPEIHFWLPTQEHTMVLRAIEMYPHDLPCNLCLRISSQTVGQPLLSSPLPSSSVGVATVSQWRTMVSNNTKRFFACPSSMQNNECGRCRACWNPKVEQVVYKKH